MKSILVRFWAVTPVGKLQFNREGPYDWRMLGTKGQITSVKGRLDCENVKAEDVLKHFGWPAKEFKPYGQTYEAQEERIRIEPAYITHAPCAGQLSILIKDDKILWFKSEADAQAYMTQEIKVKESTDVKSFVGIRKGDKVYSTAPGGIPEIFIKQ